VLKINLFSEGMPGIKTTAIVQSKFDK